MSQAICNFLKTTPCLNAFIRSRWADVALFVLIVATTTIGLLAAHGHFCGLGPIQAENLYIGMEVTSILLLLGSFGKGAAHYYLKRDDHLAIL